jgi:septation ring formation regulator EzrA
MPSTRDKVQKALNDIKATQPELADEIEKLRNDDKTVSEARELAPHLKSSEVDLKARIKQLLH